MKSVKQTDKAGWGKGSHYHLIYLNNETGQGICVEAKKHTHEIQYSPPSEVAQDPETGEEIPATPETWALLPAEDGHLHEIIDYAIDESVVVTESEKEGEIVEECFQLYKYAVETESESLEQGYEGERYYLGDQWDQRKKSELEGSNRAALTLNKSARQIDELSGYARQTRTEFVYVAKENGDQRVADAYNHVAKHIKDRCYYAREKTKVFEDAAITGRGFFGLAVSTDDDPQGDVIIERYPWSEVVCGPHEKEDLSDCEYLVKQKMVSKEKLRQLFPKKADQISADFRAYQSYDGLVHQQVKNSQYLATESNRLIPAQFGSVTMVDLALKQYRILEVWRKKYVMTNILCLPEDNFYFNAYGMKEADLKAFERAGFMVVPQKDTKVRVTRVAGSNLLSDEDPADVSLDDFNVVAVYAKKRGNRFQGKIKDIVDPQNALNKYFSLTVDILNKMAAYLWWIDEHMFPPGGKDKFMDNSTTPGAVIELVDINHRPVKEEGTKFPGELVQLIELCDRTITELANVAVTPPGANTSAAAILQQQKARLTGNEYMFDNMNFAEQKLARLLLPLIRRYYPADRMYRIMSNMNTKNPILIGGEEFTAFTEAELIALLEDADIDQYDVTVTQADASPSMKIAIYMILQEMQKQGIQVPPELPLKFVDLPEDEKREIRESLAQQSESNATAASETQKTELFKTLIAQGYMPPEVKQKYLDAPAQGDASTATNEPSQELPTQDALAGLV